MEDTVSLATVEAWISDYEAGLRSGFPDETLPPTWEEELARIDRTHIHGALRYWGTLKAFVFAAHEGKGRPAGGAEEAETAAFELLARTPVPVRLASGRTVEVTGRSLLALTEMAAHEGRITLLQAQLDDALAAFGELVERRSRAGWKARRRIRPRMRLLEEIARRTYAQVATHRERWVAHLMTESGAPAESHHAAPAWWRELADEDWARLTYACYEAGPGRYGRLGQLPEPKETGKTSAESFGAVTILSAWGVRVKIRPAELLGIDYGQQLAEMRAATPPTLDESTE